MGDLTVTIQEAVDAINAAGIAPHELTQVLLRAKVLIARNVILARIENERAAIGEARAAAESRIQALQQDLAILDAQINSQLGG